MQLTGIKVPFETLSNQINPNTVLVVISDQNGAVDVINIDRNSIPIGESFVRVNGSDTQPQSGCWVRTNGNFVWIDPCPY